MLVRPFLGIAYLAEGFRIIWQSGVRHFVLMPLLLNFIIFSLFIIFGINRFDALLDWLLPSLPDWLQWIEWLVWPLFMLGFLVAGFFFSLVLAGLLAAPFNGFLAEAVEHKLKPGTSTPPGDLLSVIREAGPALASEFRKLGYFMVRAVPLLILFVIPGLNIIAPFVWFAFSAWLLALEYLEYPLSNHGMSFPELKQIAGKHRMMILGFGIVLVLLAMVPVINFLVMPVAVAGATVMVVRQKLSST